MKRSYKKNNYSRKSKRGHNRRDFFDNQVVKEATEADKPKRKIEIPAVLSVKNFAERSGIPASDIIS